MRSKCVFYMVAAILLLLTGCVGCVSASHQPEEADAPVKVYPLYACYVADKTADVAVVHYIEAPTTEEAFQTCLTLAGETSLQNVGFTTLVLISPIKGEVDLGPGCKVVYEATLQKITDATVLARRAPSDLEKITKEDAVELWTWEISGELEQGIRKRLSDITAADYLNANQRVHLYVSGYSVVGKVQCAP